MTESQTSWRKWKGPYVYVWSGSLSVNLTWKMTETLPLHQECFHSCVTVIVNIGRDLTLYHCFGPTPIFCRVQESLGWAPSRPHSQMVNLMKLTLFFWQFAQKTLWQLHSVQVELSEKFENPRWILVSDLYQHLCSLSSSF